MQTLTVNEHAEYRLAAARGGEQAQRERRTVSQSVRPAAAVEGADRRGGERTGAVAAAVR